MFEQLLNPDLEGPLKSDIPISTVLTSRFCLGRFQLWGEPQGGPMDMGVVPGPQMGNFLSGEHSPKAT